MIKENYPSIAEIHKSSINSLSTHILICKLIDNKNVKKIASILSHYISFTDDTRAGKEINSLRNNIAHDDMFIAPSVLKKYSYIGDIIGIFKEILQLKHDDLYKKLNEFVEDNIRQ